jgi:multisubunit Na+/H+ antiporter MnhG subunit
MVDAYAVTDTTSLQKVLSLRRNSRVVLSLPSLANEESGRLQDQLNRLVSECGCSMSAGALIVAVAACGLFDAAHWSTAQAHIFQTLGINLLACFAAAALGRAGGLLRAKWKLARTVRAIEARLT